MSCCPTHITSDLQELRRWLQSQFTEDWLYAYKRVGPAMEREYHIRQADIAAANLESFLKGIPE